MAQSAPPEGRKRWTLQLLADRVDEAVAAACAASTGHLCGLAGSES